MHSCLELGGRELLLYKLETIQKSIEIYDEPHTQQNFEPTVLGKYFTRCGHGSYLHNNH